MRFLPLVAPACIAAAVVIAACGDDDAVGTSSSGGTQASSGTSGPAFFDGGQAGTSSSSSSGFVGSIDLATVTVITVTSDYCTKPPGKCFDAQAFTVDFGESSLTNTTCVELGGAPDAGSGGGTSNGAVKRTISAADLDVVKARLAALKLDESPSSGFDGGTSYGPLKRLDISTKANGTKQFFTSDGVCDGAPRAKVIDGWEELYDTLRAMTL